MSRKKIEAQILNGCMIVSYSNPKHVRGSNGVLHTQIQIEVLTLVLGKVCPKGPCVKSNQTIFIVQILKL